MRRIRQITGHIVCALLMFSTPAATQDAPKSESRLCYRGRPKPTCTRFVLTEIGVYGRAIGNERRVSYQATPTTVGQSYNVVATPGIMLTWEVGGMANVGMHNAFGGTLLLGTGLSQVGVKARYRRWLTSEGIALDFGSGIAMGNSYWTSSPTITSDVSLNAADYAAVSLRVDVGRVDGQSVTGLYGGVRLGSRPMIIGSVAAGVTVAFLAAIVSQIQ